MFYINKQFIGLHLFYTKVILYVSSLNPQHLLQCTDILRSYMCRYWVQWYSSAVGWKKFQKLWEAYWMKTFLL